MDYTDNVPNFFVFIHVANRVPDHPVSHATFISKDTDDKRGPLHCNNPSVPVRTMTCPVKVKSSSDPTEYVGR